MARLPPLREHVEYLRPPALPDVEVIIGRNWLSPWHVHHERYDICACAEADTSWRYARGLYESKDQSVMLLEPGETHRNTVMRKEADFQVLLVPPGYIQDAGKELGLRGTLHFGVPSVCGLRTKLYPAIYRLTRAVQEGASALEQQSRFAAFVRLLMQQGERRATAAPPVAAGAAVERARDYLRAHFSEAVTLDQLAHVAGLSRFHLARAFAKAFGLPPHAYQVHLRVERARQLLLGGLSPTLTAAEVGFADQSHLGRHFKREWQVTPGQYARGAA